MGEITREMGKQMVRESNTSLMLLLLSMVLAPWIVESVYRKITTRLGEIIFWIVGAIFLLITILYFSLPKGLISKYFVVAISGAHIRYIGILYKKINKKEKSKQ